MAIIERPAPSLALAPAPAVVTPTTSLGVFRRPVSSTGWRSWMFTVDHKKIGIMYGVSAMVFFVVGGIEALAIRAQLASADGTLLSADVYNQMFTMHATSMVFLFAMPMAAAFGNYFLPLQIGARDVAFPRINAFGYLVVPPRRPVHQLVVDPRRRRRRWLVHVRAELQRGRSHRRTASTSGRSAWSSPASPRRPAPST